MKHLVLSRRDKLYRRRDSANQYRRDTKKHTTSDPGGQGTEIVCEVRVCPNCYRSAVDR